MTDSLSVCRDDAVGRRRILRGLAACVAVGSVSVAWAAEGAASAPSGAPPVEVFGDLSGSACRAWMDALRRAGWTVQTQERPAEQMPRVKRWLSLPSESTSVWVARVGTYFVDGPVPVPVLERLWRARPTLRGLVVSASGAVQQVGHDGVARPVSAF